ncbi:LOW QUALITY PROTEIN: N-acetylmuramoyl-L-alanine amidase [Limimaricola cinnabarinus LL-001]|uniref:N-acetylmuramoyl-L-alanine amidase n=2 Tax=Limimaricola cinnabarinus TaxID=1125964 RepID=U3AGS2_9RHOB|nr:LOW QUALITY PROTEIN: N-acetylmuramoyl-L-alanine amidase [Limimaricola cinnabarinus LL-001]
MRRARAARGGEWVRRLLGGAGLALMLATSPAAQEFSGLARLDPSESRVADTRRGLEIELALSQPVPWRVFTLDGPRRLVIDFAQVDWSGAEAAALLSGERATALRLGRGRPGWSRLVLDLSEPLGLLSAEMRSAASGAARLHAVLAPVTAEAFAAAAKPADPAGETLAAPQTSITADGPLVVAIDPGHGGVDPGALREGLVEAELMLRLARETAEAINRSGTMRAVLTRDGDAFVPLSERMTIARAAGAGLLLSLHADALEEDEASGGSVYTLSDEAQDAASGRMVERHQRGDLLAGLDLSRQDDRVATALMDLVRLDTAPQSERLAQALVASLREAGAHLNSRPRRSAPLAVLNAADFPSVLVEVGFLSNVGDRARLTDPVGRGRIVSGLVSGIQNWAAEEAARAPLRRR